MNEGAIGINDVIQTKGYFDKTETPAKCWIYPSAHGTIGISKAIEESCNYFFYELGYRMQVCLDLTAPPALNCRKVNRRYQMQMQSVLRLDKVQITLQQHSLPDMLQH